MSKGKYAAIADRKRRVKEKHDGQTQAGSDQKSRERADTEGVGSKTINQPIKRLTIDLPEDLHTRFKIHCIQNKTKMVEEVRRFIEEQVPAQ